MQAVAMGGQMRIASLGPGPKYVQRSSNLGGQVVVVVRRVGDVL